MMKANKKILGQIKRKYKFISGPLKSVKNSAYIKKTTDYAKYYKTNKVNESYVFYQTRDGKSMTDSPYAVFLYLLNNEKYKNLYHVWAMDNQQKCNDYSK
ncbi:hypothetical protein [Staphylococcus equorum]|uniref:hypothetical protein n=1 Tax=Staphylococcus equorum TaxID=246432 RepID=UPI0021BF6C56|nr:hypothetical protein [Staphylococcus equorum]